MRYYRCADKEGYKIIVHRGGKAFNLTSVHSDLHSVVELLSAAKFAGKPIDEIVIPITERADLVPSEGLDSMASLPIVPDEVWAAGVTYEISEQARENESVLPEIYRDVYNDERPELFFKATTNRTVGPTEHIGVRKDSNWNVPEPELAVVLYEGTIVGYTIGNDVSSREIEGNNPLYLPQAKVYDRCCAIGPCFVPTSSITNPHDLEMSMVINRNGDTVWKGTTSTDEMVRTCEELVSFYRQSNNLPRLAVLLTGTSLVPNEGISLQAGDRVRIEIEDIGVLENPVTLV